jgi:hypothetical protein
MPETKEIRTLDVRATKEEDVHVEFMKTPTGLDVVYVHIDGMTRFRMVCEAPFRFDDICNPISPLPPASTQKV